MQLLKSAVACWVMASGIGFAQGAGPSTSGREQDARVRINEIQVIGTHNSYHAGFAPSEAKLMQERNPKAFSDLDYAHRALPDQLSAGVRQIEIDVYGDTEGGRFAHPAITAMVAAAHLPPDPVLDPEGKLLRPGLKVLHVTGIDQRSTCMTFVDCLAAVRTWSRAHPAHLPIFILVETKYDEPNAKPRPSAVATEPWTPGAFDRLDAEIRSVFGPAEMIAPDEVRGSHATLPEAIADGGWPTLEKARGRVLFLMDQSSATPAYTANHPALRGRLLFTNATPGAPDAAFVERNSGTAEEIGALVRQGYVVRTRTDEPTGAARANNTERRDQALQTGAQMLSTDYPASEPARWPGHYSVQLPGAVAARCNPVNAPAGCQTADLAP